MRYLAPEIGDALAAEYVLGTLRGPARRRFESLLRAHPILARRVGRWERALNRMAAMTPPVDPPRGLYRRIRDRVFPVPSRPGRLDRLGFWKGLSAAGGLAAAALAFVLYVQPFRVPMGYVAVISDAQHNPVWMISADPGMERVHVKNTKAMEIAKGVQCLLWVKARSGDVYRVGVLPDNGGTTSMDIDPEMRERLSGHLMVTIEDTTDKMPLSPGGPALYRGIWMPIEQT